ncbi:MFS transporter [Silicimonas algicola]|uniref:Cyanate permease n=1 Tax=Silicimonas algicola TaxID=1826607 RepID=A0A316G8R2_9RHOB|nr:MFS transporter [Silicimonas algicola]AZQ67282.1 MFS transporter [Silicimonas algicola]PWK56953.1 cyanate permease [Silicimonas algicola]
MRLLISFAALFTSVVLLQLGAGGVAPLDAISGIDLGFTTAQVGLLGSAHFLGFFVGCWWAPRLMGSVGHSRAFAAFTAVGTIGILSHMLVVDAYAWMVMRGLSGLCVAGCYTIVESWLQAKVTNETRGRAMGIYRVVDIVGSLAAQLMISVLDPASYVSYNILAIVCCAALVPLVLTRVEQPAIPVPPRLRPGLAFRHSPLAAAGVISSGVTGAAFRMVGPVYGIEVGLSVDTIALFLAAYVLGGAVAQYPAGWFADRYDRRWVLVFLSILTIVASAGMIFLPGAAFVTAAFFGFSTFPIYSVAAAHAHDFATQDERVDLSASLMFLYAVGAIASPWLVSTLIEAYGPAAMFIFVGAAHIILIGFGLLRMRVRDAERRTRYVYAPRTSFVIGRLLGRFRDER